MEFHEALRAARKEKGLTQKEMAQKIGCTTAAYGHYETGKRNPDIEGIKKISAALGVSPDSLIGYEKSEEAELQEYLEQLKTRPEMRMLFKLSAQATKEDVEQAVRIIEAIRKRE